MSTWNEDELISYCEKLIARKTYVVAEEMLWEMNKRNRSNTRIMMLLGQIFEETKQYELAARQFESALLLLPEDPNLQARFDKCKGRTNDTAERQSLNELRVGVKALQDVGKLGDKLHNTEYLLSVARQQLLALRKQTWPEIGALPTEHWTLSEAEIDALTMGGRAAFEYWPGHTADTLTRTAGFPQIYTDEQIDHFLEMIGRRAEYCYRIMDTWLYEAIGAYPIDGMDGVVIGSLSPWYESICLHFGARPTAVDYTKIICKTSRMKAIGVDEFYNLENTFDFGISISSVEHDGLGAYETPISPDADLLAMRKLSHAVKPGGLVYFNVPVGQDRVEYPANRTYGRLRLPKLLEGWEIVKSWGFKDEYYDIAHPPEPFFVLRNAK